MARQHHPLIAATLEQTSSPLELLEVSVVQEDLTASAGLAPILRLLEHVLRRDCRYGELRGTTHFVSCSSVGPTIGASSLAGLGPSRAGILPAVRGRVADSSCHPGGVAPRSRPPHSSPATKLRRPRAKGARDCRKFHCSQLITRLVVFCAKSPIAC
jgi:hypothetical protein